MQGGKWERNERGQNIWCLACGTCDVQVTLPEHAVAQRWSKSSDSQNHKQSVVKESRRSSEAERESVSHAAPSPSSHALASRDLGCGWTHWLAVISLDTRCGLSVSDTIQASQTFLDEKPRPTPFGARRSPKADDALLDVTIAQTPQNHLLNYFEPTLHHCVAKAILQRRTLRHWGGCCGRLSTPHHLPREQLAQAYAKGARNATCALRSVRLNAKGHHLNESPRAKCPTRFSRSGNTALKLFVS